MASGTQQQIRYVVIDENLEGDANSCSYSFTLPGPGAPPGNAVPPPPPPPPPLSQQSVICDLENSFSACLTVLVAASAPTVWMGNSPRLEVPASSNIHYLARCGVCDALFDAKEYLSHTQTCKLEKYYK
ncbi:unnamed protein product [Gongylonema pulchrum]|uniref:C2H2-type domain-containing protein n=1 Tax=Gongylonema pulchrum TaxID=637853 RepID=A0A183EMD4_9BILA|nr:unnamed protein product [Gongylonema pulchrum]